jgi:hypothetical protein
MPFGRKNKKKSGGFAAALGIKTEAVPTATDKVKDERQKKIQLAWDYLRDRIDKSIHDYYRTGTFDRLEQFVERPALDALKSELSELKAQNIYWHQPDRTVTTQRQIKVISEELNKRGQPTRFVIQERFKDFSVHQRIEPGQLVPEARAPGTERVILATVNVNNGHEYKLHSVILDKGASLE